MKNNGFKLRMSYKLLICNSFYKRQMMNLSFMTLGFVQ
jgi:hypothetical protein